jgi:exodeoxyribonuclease VIII
MTTLQFEAGVYHDMPETAYHAIEAFSASGAKQLLRSAAHYVASRAEPREPTPNMQLGTAVHRLVLEPDRAGDVIAAPDVDRRTKAGKEAYEAFKQASAGKLVLAPEDYERAHRCADAVAKHPIAWQLFSGAETETTSLWHRDGVRCKARVDAISGTAIVDLKTTQDASPEGVAKAIASFGYHVQEAHYRDALEAQGMFAERFVFVFVETQAPYLVTCAQIDEHALGIGRAHVKKAFKRYQQLMLGEIPAEEMGYEPIIHRITLPAWLKT